MLEFFDTKKDLYNKLLDYKVVENYLKSVINMDGVIIIEPKYTIPVNYIERTSNDLLREAFINKKLM